ncbi:MAG: DUF3311 domain-containing protein [Acidobacteriota bacterium]|nr:DUF3311 domain-containing protein [Acidobacteriota bacterium]
MADQSHPTDEVPKASARRGSRSWLWLLLLPYLGLCFPALYARATPALFGFPFFYWYQFGWVILASALMGIVYWKVKS